MCAQPGDQRLHDRQVVAWGNVALRLELERVAVRCGLDRDVEQAAVFEDIDRKTACDRVLTTERLGLAAQPVSGSFGKEGRKSGVDHRRGVESQDLVNVDRDVIDQPVGGDRDQAPEGLDISEKMDRFTITV